MKEQALAKQNTSAASTAGVVGVLRRKCDCGTHTIGGGACEACSEKQQVIQRRPEGVAERASNTAEVPTIVNDVLRSPGLPLDAATRSFMEPRFGHDFSKVRVHTDARAAESARKVNALAYTVGQDIVFGAGQHSPHTLSGQRLLAHELTHTVQQRSHNTVFQGSLVVGSADDAYERAADEISERVMSPGIEGIGGLSPISVMRLQRKCSSPGGCIGGRWVYDYDGCSGPSGMAGKLVDAFFDKDNPARGKDTHFAKCLPSSNRDSRPCDRHDECYQTCHHGNASAQAQCDLQMGNDMIDICANHSEDNEERKDCMDYAIKYYVLLRIFGSAAYNERQAQVCPCEAKTPAKRAKPSERLQDKAQPQDSLKKESKPKELPPLKQKTLTMPTPFKG